MDTALKLSLCLLPALLNGCLGVSPEEARQRAIEDRLSGGGGRWEDDDGDEEHNPGTPCLACHSRDYNAAGEDPLAVAGTIYLFATDADTNGLPGVTVHLRDALGREMSTVSNGSGNFMFGGDDDDDDDGRRGGRFWPEYPIQVWIEQGGVTQYMLAPIRREGSCATCHDREASATSIGRVFLMEPSP